MGKSWPHKTMLLTCPVVHSLNLKLTPFEYVRDFPDYHGHKKRHVVLYTQYSVDRSWIHKTMFITGPVVGFLN